MDAVTNYYLWAINHVAIALIMLEMDLLFSSTLIGCVGICAMILGLIKSKYKKYIPYSKKL